MTHHKSSRRAFLQTAAATASAAVLTGRATASVQQPPVPANDRIGIATIGMGQQGTSVTRAATSLPGVVLVGVADLYSGRRERAREVYGKDLATTADYRELLQRKDIDAVIVATSDHWHSRVCVDAMDAGKDVYCEKPMVQSFEEGHQVIEAARRTKRILQVGSQRTSSELYHKAAELFRAGAIGDLILVESWYHRSSENGAWRYVVPPDASPETVDWDRFLGSAPKRPFDALRFFRWRNFWDYGTGIPGDLFVHLLTGLHFIVGSQGPVQVISDGGLRLWKEDREVPDLVMALCRYPRTENHPAFNLSLNVNFADHAEESGFRFVGSEGIMSLGRNGLEIYRAPRNDDIHPSISTFPAALQRQLLEEHGQAEGESEKVVVAESTETYQSTAAARGNEKHFETFLAGIRSRQPVVQDPVFGLRAAGPALLCNLSYKADGKPLGWDPVAMKAV